MLDYDIRKRLQ